MSKELGQSLRSYEEVRDEILEHIENLPKERVSLRAAQGRVLRQSVVCMDTIPPFDASAMDGYAIRAQDIEAASDDNPIVLKVSTTIPAGDSRELEIAEGQAARIMTGAPVPQGADLVVPHELTRFTDTEVIFNQSLPQGKNIRPRGGDMRPGLVVLQEGYILGGPQVAVAATVGETKLEVSRRPRVAILSPGKELVEPDCEPGQGQIRNSNAYCLAAFVTQAGGIADVRGIIDDTPEALREEIRLSIEQGADLLLSTGGVSAGDFDHVHRVITQDGNPGNVYKTDMRPGKPQAFGLLQNVPFMGMPGNPAAAIVSFIHFVRPMLRKMLGVAPFVPPPFSVRFTEDYTYKGGRVFMLRGLVEPAKIEDGGGFIFTGAGDQDSGFLASMALANAVIRLPADQSVAQAGQSFPAWWIHDS